MTRVFLISAAAFTLGWHLPALGAVDIEVTKTASVASIVELENVEFTITVRNLGTDPATGVAIFDALPSELSFVSAIPTAGSFSLINRRWTLPDLGGGATETLALTANANLGSGGTLVTNTAQVQSLDQSDTDPGNDVDSADVNISVRSVPTLSRATLSLLATLLAVVAIISLNFLRQRDHAQD